MSRIDELVERLCPDGVVFRSLGEVASVSTGTRPPKAILSDHGPFGYFNGGSSASGRVMETNSNAGMITIPSRGSVGIVGYQHHDFWCGPLCYRIASSSDQLSTRFLYFALKTTQGRIVSLQQTGSIPALNKKQLVALSVPVPPLEVQVEIVRILDCFTSLEAELEAELEARRQQFDQYRRRQMTFLDSVPRVRIGDVAEVRSGWGFPLVDQGRRRGELPFFKVGDMNAFGNGTHLSVANNYVSPDVAKKLGVRPAPAGTVVFPKIGAAVATNKKRILSQSSAYDNNVMGLIPNGPVLSSFLYHWFQTIDLVDLANDSGAVPSIRKSVVENQMMPLPSVDAQGEISVSLDLFDLLSNSLTAGIPAEISARRQQYEHYRDRLLAFKEKAS